MPYQDTYLVHSGQLQQQFLQCTHLHVARAVRIEDTETLDVGV